MFDVRGADCLQAWRRDAGALFEYTDTSAPDFRRGSPTLDRESFAQGEPELLFVARSLACDEMPRQIAVPHTLTFQFMEGPYRGELSNRSTHPSAALWIPCSELLEFPDP